MPATISTTRLSRVALLAVTGATALSVAACGASDNAKPTSANPTSPAPSSSSSPAASAKGKDWVNGLIDSVSGNTIQVSQPSGTATVDFTPSTAVSELTPAHLTDVTAGSCISVHPDRHGTSTAGGAITARAVRISTAVDGKCPQPNEPTGATTGTPPGVPAAHHQISGQVASVTGNTITLNSADSGGNSSQTSVTVTDTTKYTKQSTADAQAIAQGKCIAAHGTTDGGGTLQATTISVRQSDNGSCPQPGGKHHRH
jgi:Domain of unknown function (DUF5666)